MANLPIQIAGPDGTVYPSATKAANALGVSRATLNRHLERFGSLVNLGNLIGTRVPVTGPDGEIYPSKADAARSLGVDVATISRHMAQYGNLDMTGTATTRCEWRGQIFNSVTEAAKVIGVAPHSVSYHLTRYGNLDRAGLGCARPFGQQRAAKPLQIGPLRFDSAVKASKALGVSEHTIQRAKRPTASPASRQRLLELAMVYHAKQAPKPARKQWQMEEAF